MNDISQVLKTQLGSLIGAAHVRGLELRAGHMLQCKKETFITIYFS